MKNFPFNIYTFWEKKRKKKDFMFSIFIKQKN